MHYLNFFPIILFTIASRFLVTHSDASWVPVFFIGAGAVVIQMVYFWHKKIQYDYLAVGSNLFLMYGAVAFILAGFIKSKSILTLIFSPITIFGLASIFPFFLISGILATLFCQAGFIQFPNHQKKHVLAGSFTLLAVISLAFIVSFALIKYYNAGTFFGGVVPFFAVFAGREFIRNYFMNKTN